MNYNHYLFEQLALYVNTERARQAQSNRLWQKARKAAQKRAKLDK